MISGSPRPSPSQLVYQNITSGFDVPTVIRFVAQAYPVPLPSDIIWQRCNETCQVLQSSTKINISTDGLETNLTLFNVHPSDFGHYRLYISNAVGNFSQNFYLSVEGIVIVLTYNFEKKSYNDGRYGA